MQVRYEPTADRVLWQLRTATGELFAVWLTRRMLRQLWPHLDRLVTQASVLRLAPHATVLPEARDMLAQAARSRHLPNTDFATPFDAKATALPLGALPLLPVAIDLGPGPDGRGLALAAREPDGRNIRLALSDDLATGLVRLLEQALRQTDWGILAPGSASDQAAKATSETDTAAAAAPVTLN
jgi:hypothetical protein